MTFKRVTAALVLLLLSLLARFARPERPLNTQKNAAENCAARQTPCADTHPLGVASGSSTRRPLPPHHIKIGEVVYTVETVDEVPGAAETAQFSGKTCDGHAFEESWCEATDRIYLRAGLPLEQERTTLLHEIQHSILGTGGRDRKASYHEFIYQLSPKLLQVLRDNPDLYAYLTAAESSVR
ncbi:MAG TPA: hypothetical protein VES66_02900 [Terriglobales bacterium]|nr:hypothetical protein [Terriglobales bacterium]